MSDYLKELLEKVKKNVDELESPAEQQDSEEKDEFRSSDKKKFTKPGSPTKPVLKSHFTAKSDLFNKPGLVTKPGLQGPPDNESDLGSKSGLITESGSPTKPDWLQLFRNVKLSRQVIQNLIPSLKDSELRLYSYLVEKRYENSRSVTSGLVSYSQKEAMQATGIKSTATIVKSMNSLIKKKLIKWVRKSHRRGEVSQIKVFLPKDGESTFTDSDDQNSE
jgi:hypothetical protein